jgi:hypothetical protein
MSIPESQLRTWSHQGSITQSSITYNTIKNALESADNPYSGKNYKIFLQGSYGNDTNIYSESDVDIVIQLDDIFESDVSSLPDYQTKALYATYPDSMYTYANFKNDVLSVLNKKYGNQASSGDKALHISAHGNRRNADVVVAIQFRRYYKFNGIYDQSYDEGICFYDAAWQRIVNFPKHHSKNLTAKHQMSQGWLKPMIRVMKNLREKLVDDKKLASSVAPSYYLEGLLYNVPADLFTTSHEDCFINCINWIQKADKDKFVCANEQYYLLRDGSPITWRASKCEEFLSATIELWNEW